MFYLGNKSADAFDDLLKRDSSPVEKSPVSPSKSPRRFSYSPILTAASPRSRNFNVKKAIRDAPSSSNAQNEWKSIQTTVVALFNRKKLAEGQLTLVLGKVRNVIKSNLGPLLTEYYKKNLIGKGMIILREEIKNKTGKELLYGLAGVWTHFYESILPVLQAIFSPVQRKGLTIKQITLVAFRDLIILKVGLRECLDTMKSEAEDIPEAIVQMLLVVQTVFDWNVANQPPTDGYLRLEAMVALVANPYVGFQGIYKGEPAPAILATQLDYMGPTEVKLIPKRKRLSLQRPISLDLSEVKGGDGDEDERGETFRLSASVSPERVVHRPNFPPKHNSLLAGSPGNSLGTLTEMEAFLGADSWDSEPGVEELYEAEQLAESQYFERLKRAVRDEAAAGDRDGEERGRREQTSDSGTASGGANMNRNLSMPTLGGEENEFENSPLRENVDDATARADNDNDDGDPPRKGDTESETLNYIYSLPATLV